MKKILLGTTGLVGAALLASAASAETPKVTLGGFSDFQAGYVSDDKDQTKNNTGFRNDNTVIVKVDGKTTGGLGYGAQIDLEADVTADANNETGTGGNASRTFTYLEGNFGRAEMGSNKSVAATQRVDASTIAVATGGINGSFNQFVSNQNALGANFISTSKLTTEHGSYSAVGDESLFNATKVSYYTPKFAGFQGGISYTPQVNDRGQSVTRADNTGLEDVLDLGLTYDRAFNGGYKLNLSGTYETASATNTTVGVLGGDDVSAWNLGGSLAYQGFSVAGSYGDIADTGIRNTEGNYYTVGAAYKAGPVGVSATWIDSQVETVGAAVDNDFSNLVLGADYKLAPGLTPYAEVSFYDFDASGTANDNQGTAVILGTQVAF